MCTLVAFAIAEFTCLASVATAGGDPTGVGVPEAADVPVDDRGVEAAPELPPPQAATSSMAAIAAAPVPRCRTFTSSSHHQNSAAGDGADTTTQPRRRLMIRSPGGPPRPLLCNDLACSRNN